MTFIEHFYTLPSEIKKHLKSQKAQFGFGNLGETVYKRTYSRQKFNGKQEEWSDTIIRVVEGTISTRKDHYIKNNIEWDQKYWDEYVKGFSQYMFDMKFLPPGRGLWSMGTKHVIDHGGAALNNCGFVSNTDFVSGCCWTKDMLMRGVGVGFDNLWDGEYIKPDKNKTFVYQIPDSREGWVNSLGYLMRSYVENTQWKPLLDENIQESTYVDGNKASNKASNKACNAFPIFDYSLIRQKGERIRGFGGSASGPDPLKKLHRRVEVFFDTYISFQESKNHVKSQVKKFWCGYKTYEGGIIKDFPDDIMKILFRGEKRRIFNTLIDRLSLARCSDLALILNKVDSSVILTGKYEVTSEYIKNNISKEKFEIIEEDLKNLFCIFGDTTYMRSKVEEYIDDKTYGISRLVTDIVNSIAATVIAGNVRRSATISLGETGDNEFLNLKNYEMNAERCYISWASNNSVRFKNNDDFKHHLREIAERIKDNGEPGIFNQINVNKYGRVGHTPMAGTRECEKDMACGPNPCAEQPLESYELCNLSELFPMRCMKNGEFDNATYTQAAKYATFYASTVSLLLTDYTQTNEIIRRNRRIGVSTSGYADLYDNLNDKTKMVNIYLESYKTIRIENIKWASEARIPEAIRCTTVKPSGTVSLLAGVSPGMHFPAFSIYIRRMRIASNHKLVKCLKDANIPWEYAFGNDNTLVFEFPVSQGKTRSATDVSVWEKMDHLKTLQNIYSDNMVSNTLTFDFKTEANSIVDIITLSLPNIKSASFLPIKEEVCFPQMPYERITLEEYNRRMAEIKEINFEGFDSSDGNMPKFCTNDNCSI